MQAATTHAILVTTDQAAEILNLTRRGLEERRRRGGGPPYVRVSPTCIRYRVADLQQWIEERTFESRAEESEAELAGDAA